MPALHVPLWKRLPVPQTGNRTGPLTGPGFYVRCARDDLTLFTPYAPDGARIRRGKNPLTAVFRQHLRPPASAGKTLV